MGAHRWLSVASCAAGLTGWVWWIFGPRGLGAGVAAVPFLFSVCALNLALAAGAWTLRAPRWAKAAAGTANVSFPLYLVLLFAGIA